MAPDRNHSIAAFKGFATTNSDVTKGIARWWRWTAVGRESLDALVGGNGGRSESRIRDRPLRLFASSPTNITE
jgi:hypothetical protein